MPRFNAFCGNVHTISLKIFPGHCEMYRFEKKFNKKSRERKSTNEFIEKVYP